MNIGDYGEIGSYGEMSFIFRYERKFHINDEPPYIEDGIICMVRIADINEDEVKFIDLDGRPYRALHKDVRYFKPKKIRIPKERIKNQ